MSFSNSSNTQNNKTKSAIAFRLKKYRLFFHTNLVLNTTENNFLTVNKDSKANALVAEYSDLFDDKLGGYEYSKITVNLKPNVKQIFRKPFSIAYAYKEKVGKELDRLEALGVIEKVENSVWGTPLTPVLKTSGQVRVDCVRITN